MIITIGDKENLLQGSIVVLDKDKLKEYRDSLLIEDYNGMDPNYGVVMSRTGLVSLGDTYIGSYRDGNYLVRNFNFVADYYEEAIGDFTFYYDKKIIGCRHLNSILLFNSLLGELDSYYLDPLALEFSKVGIFNISSFENVWHDNASNLLKKDNIDDLKAFRFALQSGILKYSVEDCWMKEEILHMNILKKLGVDLQTVIANSKIIGTNRSLMRKK